MNKLNTLTLAILSSLTLSACSMAPTYERPEPPVPAQWGQESAGVAEQDQQTLADLGWRNFYRDPALQQLIEVALENNRDLRVAALNVEAFRAQYRISRSALYPGVGVDGSATRQRVPEDLSMFGQATTTSQYGLTVGVSAYELDFFGRLRSLSDAALEAYLATEEAQRSAQLGLVSDVALAYMTWRTDQELLELARETLASYEESLAMIEASESAGVASALEVRQQRSLVQQTRALVAQFSRQVAQDLNALQLLLGTTLPADLPPGLPLEEGLLANLPVGLPSELLARRPDLRAAERYLLAANANIGAARAAFFPSIRLTAAAGTASDELSGLFDGGSRTWSFMPQINLPIFTAGRLRANLDYAEVSKDIRIAQYEKSIQNAFREVADGLAARETYDDQLQAQRDLVQTAREYYELAQQRYDSGVENYLTVLDARRNLLLAQQQLLGDRLAQLSSEVRLYKALGGGWYEQDLSSAN